MLNSFFHQLNNSNSGNAKSPQFEDSVLRFACTIPGGCNFSNQADRSVVGLERELDSLVGKAMNEANPLRIAAVVDIHYTKSSKGALQDLFAEASKTADVLVVCGDFTDFGLPEEASVLAEDIKAHVRIPVIGVVGNHLSRERTRKFNRSLNRQES